MERMLRNPVVSGFKESLYDPITAYKTLNLPGASQSGESWVHNQLTSPLRLPDKPVRKN